MTIITKATDYQMQYKHWCWLKRFTPNQITDEWWLILQQLAILGVVSLNHERRKHIQIRSIILMWPNKDTFQPFVFYAAPHARHFH